MDAADYLAADAVGLAALVAADEVTVEEVAAAATARHEATDDAINAVVEWYDDPAPVEAIGGPFAGVPFLRKDIGAGEAGRLVEMGSRLAAGLRATVTDPYLTSITAAGARVVGRSTVPEFAQHGTTESDAVGPTRNPLDLARSPGGSSGGAGAAVRAGVVPLAHASDAAGSIRIPASVCGLIGLKPTRGSMPGEPGAWRGLVTEFVLTRSVRDLDAALRVLSLETIPVDVGAGSLRIAVSIDHWAGLALDPDVRAAVEATVALLEDQGHRVTAVERPFDYDRLMSTWVPLFDGGVVDAIDEVAARTGRSLDGDHLEPHTLRVVDGVRALGSTAWAEAEETGVAVTTQLGTALADHDLLLTPTLDRPVIPLDRFAGHTPMDQYLADGDEWFSRLYLANVTGWPALSVPAPPHGASSVGDPPPIGVQFMARPGREVDLVRAARALVGDTVIAPVDPLSAPAEPPSR